TMGELFPEPVAQEQLAVVQQVIREDRGVVAEALTVVRGQPHWYRAAVQPIHNDTGQVIYALVHAIDVHALKTTQEELRALNQTLEERVAQRTAEVRDLYDHAPVGYHSLDRDGRIVHINQTELDWLGYTREELIGCLPTVYLAPASYATFQASFPRFKEQGWIQDIEVELQRKDGSTFPVLLSATAVYDDAGAFVMSRSTLVDITARTQAEEARRTSAAKLQAALESMTDAVFISDTEGRFVDFNTAFVTFHKFRTRAECATTLAANPAFLDVFLPDGSLAPLDQWAVPRALRGERVTNAEYHLRRKDTGETWVGSYSFAPIRAGDDTIVGSVVVGRDITERKQTEAALRESEQRYRTLVEQMTQGVLVYQDEQVVFGNAAAAQIIGCSVEDLQRASLGELADLLHTDDLRRVMIRPEERPGAGSVTAEPFRFTRMADGALRWVFATSTITTAHGRPAVLAVFTDVTALKLAEEQLRLSEARLHLLLDKTPAVIFSSLAEPDFRSTFISESVRQVLGYEPAQFMSSPSFWANRIHPEDKAGVFGDAPQLLAQGWRQYEYRCRHADGSYRWVESGVSLLPAMEGHPAEVVGYM
ncbi:MAG: PAS domain S-box protein, partial [Chloroflexales bacterium]|nr:PAS domain S-box protein [Chloroflexales bacterium]